MFAIHLLFGLVIIYRAAANILVLPIDASFVIEEFRDMPSTFGNGLPYDGLHGIIAYRDDGCSPMDPPPPNHTNYHKWIALVARYNCSFEEKVRNAQTATFDGVIVHNVGSDALEIMSAKNSSGIHIPSVFVGEVTGNILNQLYSYKDPYFVIINSEMPFNINTHLLLPFAIVVGICFIIMMVFMVAKFIRDRRRQRRERLSSSALNKIPVKKFEKGDPYETCAICLDDYIEGEKLRILPCAHAYHSVCIDPWLTKNKRVCPVCKRRVFAHNERRYAHDSDSDTDTDDRTPLLRPGVGGRVTTGGTFDAPSDSSTSIPEVATAQPNAPFVSRVLRALRNFSSQSSSSPSLSDTSASTDSLFTPGTDVAAREGQSGNNFVTADGVEHSINADRESNTSYASVELN